MAAAARTRSVISGLLNSLVSSVSTRMKLEPRQGGKTAQPGEQTASSASPLDVIKSLLNRP